MAIVFFTAKKLVEIGRRTYISWDHSKGLLCVLENSRERVLLLLLLCERSSTGKRRMASAAPSSGPVSLTDAEYRKLVQKPLSRSVDMTVGKK